MIRTYRPLPDIPNGYPLDDVWSVVVPIARTNLVTNPSFETNTTSWTAIGGSIARSTTYQYHGAYSLAITPTATVTDGARFDTVSLTSGTTYAYSAKVRGIGGLKYKIAIETTGAVELASVTFTATGRWQWIFGYYTETSTTTRRFTARKTTGNTSIGIFYLDGVQVEAIASGELVSTYIDGDQLGLVPNQNPVAYYWNGTPHASTSARSGLTRAGGMVMPFRKYGFILTAIVGLGLAAPLNVATEYARLDGGYDDYTRKPTRQFTLTGRFQGKTYRQLRDLRGDLADLLDRDLIAQDQRLTLLRYVEDMRGVQVTDTARIFAKYQGGLGGNTDNMHAEATPITFTQYLPNVMSDGESGSALTVQLSVANANAIIKRSQSGTWSALSTGLSGGTSARALLAHPNGYIYVGGAFTGAGASGADYMARYDPSTDSFANIASSDTTFNQQVIGMALHPDGRIIMVGDFTNASGIAAADFIAALDPTANTIAALGTGASAGVTCCAVDSSGRIWGGAASGIDFGGVANTNGIGYYDGAAWNALGTGLGGGGCSTILPVGSRIYIGGNFPSVNAVANTANLAYYDFNDSLWHSVTSGTFTGTTVNDLILMPNQTILVIGTFTVIGGVSASNLALYNGVSFTQVGAGVTGGNSEAGIVDPVDQTAWVAGNFTTINGITIPSPLVQIVGGVTGSSMSVVPADVDLPGAPKVRSVAFGANATIYVAFDTTGTATAAGVTTVTNPGSARAYPTIVINGPSAATARIYSILNTTTNRSIYLNLTLNINEIATLVFQPDNLSFISNVQGDIAGTIMPGSTIADFFLQPGANTIAFLSASSTVTATIAWRPAYTSLDDVN